jgi:hypothetical protein
MQEISKAMIAASLLQVNHERFDYPGFDEFLSGGAVLFTAHDHNDRLRCQIVLCANLPYNAIGLLLAQLRVHCPLFLNAFLQWSRHLESVITTLTSAACWSRYCRTTVVVVAGQYVRACQLPSSPVWSGTFSALRSRRGHRSLGTWQKGCASLNLSGTYRTDGTHKTVQYTTSMWTPGGPGSSLIMSKFPLSKKIEASAGTSGRDINIIHNGICYAPASPNIPVS